MVAFNQDCDNEPEQRPEDFRQDLRGMLLEFSKEFATYAKLMEHENPPDLFAIADGMTAAGGNIIRLAIAAAQTQVFEELSTKGK